MTRRLRRDERGASTLVSHILAIGITSLLIVGLLVSGSSYLQDQQRYAGQDGIETVGNELARDVSQLLRLSAGDGEATITTELPERVAGRSYDAEVRDGTTCDRLESTPESCLVLEINGLDITRNVPLSVDESNISMNRLGPGRYQLDYTGPGLGEADADSDVTRISMRVGIGDDVQQERDGGNIVGRTNLPPTNVSFRMDPEWPDSSRDIEFTADAVDPDAVDPGDPGMNYSWDFDSDGTYEVVNSTTETATYNYGSYGRKNVTLRVTDERGASTWESKNISVAGLQYVDSSIQTTDSAFDGEDISFRMENTHNEDIEIIGLYFNPIDNASRIEAQDECDEFEDDEDDECEDYVNQPEIQIDTQSNGDWDYSYDFKGEDYYEDDISCGDDGSKIPDTGITVSAVYKKYDSFSGCTIFNQKKIDASVPDGDSVTIQFRGITGLSSEKYKFGIQYRIETGTGSVTNVTRFDTGNVS